MNYIQPFESPMEANAMARYGLGQAEENNVYGFDPWQQRRNAGRLMVEK
jgi:hypothetical protein